MKIELRTGEINRPATTMVLDMKITGDPLRPPGQFLRQEWRLIPTTFFRLVAKDHKGFFVAKRGTYAHLLNFFFFSGSNAMADYEKWTKDKENHYSFYLGELNGNRYRVGSESDGWIKNPMNNVGGHPRLQWKIIASG